MNKNVGTAPANTPDLASADGVINAASAADAAGIADVPNAPAPAPPKTGILRKIFLGPPLRPLTRKEFFPLALKLMLTRMPLSLVIILALAHVLENFTVPDWPVIGLAILAILISMSFLLPYFKLIHWRVAGSAFPFPKTAVLGAAFVLFNLFSVADGLINCWPQELACYVALYLVIYTLPDGTPQKANASETGQYPCA